MINNKQVAIVGTSIQLSSLAASLQLSLLAEKDEGYEFLLMEQDGMLTLCWQAAKQPVFLTIDFLHGQLAYRQKQALSREAIVKAVGAKGAERPHVLDATAGLGRDAFILASLGCQVTLIEQNAVIAALLEDGIKRLLQQQPLSMQFIEGNAVSIMNSLNFKPDVVYLDPMFPPRNKSALVKKDMQILQRLTHDTPMNDAVLFQTALQCAAKRVVVKRPNYAPTLTAQAANFVIRTEHHRFDIYSTHR